MMSLSKPALEKGIQSRSSAGRSGRDKVAAMTKSPKRPRDPNQLAKFIVDSVTQPKPEVEESVPAGKNAAVTELGRLGG